MLCAYNCAFQLNTHFIENNNAQGKKKVQEFIKILKP